MYRLIKTPKPLSRFFNNLCLSQVKEQLPENLICYTPNPTSFVYDGHLFFLAHNRSFIMDESLAMYGIHLNFSHTLN